MSEFTQGMLGNTTVVGGLPITKKKAVNRSPGVHPGQLRIMPKGRVAHIVSSNEDELWVGEAMSLCGKLLIASDRIAGNESRVCVKCQNRQEQQ